MPTNSEAAKIESRSQLINALSKGCKPKDQWRIGTEHEKFVFSKSDHKHVGYFGEKGIQKVLEQIQSRSQWTPIFEGENLIGLKDPEKGGAISLEPGGQVELSGAALTNLHQTCAETYAHLEILSDIAKPLEIGFLGMGVAPTWELSEISAMPKARYGIMAPYMEKVGTLGTSMMFRSCTIQANLDFSDEQDMVKKLRVALALQPIATALFANSPFLDGRPNGYLSFRSHIWEHTDNDRSGMLPFAFEDGMGFERYVDYALDVPMYFVIRDGQYINCAGESFHEFLKGKLPQLKGELPSEKDWEDHLSTIFPEVRLKQFLEMRGADSGPWKEICALPAFWVGLMYDATALDAAWDLVKDWSDEERQHLRHEVPKTALQTKFRNETVQQIAQRALEISAEGLRRRNIKNWENIDETQYLFPIEKIAETGITRAQHLLGLYQHEWAGDLDQIFCDPHMVPA